MLRTIKNINTKIQIIIITGGLFIITLAFIFGLYANNKTSDKLIEKRTDVLKIKIKNQLQKKWI